jgi:hypothetical protein
VKGPKFCVNQIPWTAVEGTKVRVARSLLLTE